METVVETALRDVVLILALAGTVGAFAARYAHIPYPVALLLVGLVVSLADVQFGTDLSPAFLSDVILSVLVPALVFEGASRVNFDRFVENAAPIFAFAVVGLLTSVFLFGFVGTVVFGFPLIVSLVFAAIVLPTDPVAVLPIFKNLGVPERLTILVDGESMLNDGVGVVLYTVLVGVALDAGEPSAATFGSGEVLIDIVVGVVVATVGGLLLGAITGSVVFWVVGFFEDTMTTVILTFVLAYGTFLLGEEVGVSGVIAVVGASLFVAERRWGPPLNTEARRTVRTTWASVAFVANTFLFVVVGVTTPFELLVEHAWSVVSAVVLVFLARAVVVYPLAGLSNRGPVDHIPRSYQHVLVWSGIHVSIPLALALGLPAAFPDALTEQLRAMVFGVATASLGVQGLSMKPLVDRLGLVTTTDR
jgi:CPA1 family monovalent cation:H+ antiporter